jgi:branched-chain amino acid transport system ATP-binding protein
MSAPLLSARSLSVRFGGVLAVNDVSFDVQQGEVFTLIGPNGAGKTTVFNLISRIYEPTAGTIEFMGRDITGVAPHEIASLGIARTFQNIELFEHATVLHNLLIGRHRHRKTGVWSDLLFNRSVREAELASRRKVEEVIDFLEREAKALGYHVEMCSHQHPSFLRLFKRRGFAAGDSGLVQLFKCL